MSNLKLSISRELFSQVRMESELVVRQAIQQLCVSTPISVQEFTIMNNNRAARDGILAAISLTVLCPTNARDHQI